MRSNCSQSIKSRRAAQLQPNRQASGPHQSIARVCRQIGQQKPPASSLHARAMTTTAPQTNPEANHNDRDNALADPPGPAKPLAQDLLHLDQQLHQLPVDLRHRKAARGRPTAQASDGRRARKRATTEMLRLINKPAPLSGLFKPGRHLGLVLSIKQYNQPPRETMDHACRESGPCSSPEPIDTNAAVHQLIREPLGSCLDTYLTQRRTH